MKKLKTGDIVQVRRGALAKWRGNWGVIRGYECHAILSCRSAARELRNVSGIGRIARILSIGPKYVTVRISK